MSLSRPPAVHGRLTSPSRPPTAITDLRVLAPDLLRTRAAQSSKAVWKTLEPASDVMPKMSFSQEKLAYIPPAPGTIPTKHRNTKGIFGQFVDKAIRLKVQTLEPKP